MSAHERPLIGSVFERNSSRAPSVPSPRFSGAPGTGFPTARHRFKSAFARARDEANSKSNDDARSNDVPDVASDQRKKWTSVPPTSLTVDSKPIPTDTNALLRQIHEDNTRMIARMSDVDIEKEKFAILGQLGEGTGQLLRRVQEARLRREAKEGEERSLAELEAQPTQEAQENVKDTVDRKDAHKTTERDRDHELEHVPLVASPAPRRVPHGLAIKPGVLRVKSLENIGRTVTSPLPATSSTRPSSRTGRKLRFAEVTPDDVHVYESAPRSPKRTIFALPPPPETKDDSIVSLGAFRKGATPFKRPHSTHGSPEEQIPRSLQGGNEPEEGTPEYIRRRYFPSVAADDASLAWMEAPSLDTTESFSPRFDLRGVPIPASLSALLPSHLGLHHHAEGARAGYTIDDIFLLARSTVPAQRATMLGILAKIAHRLGRQVQQCDGPGEVVVFAGQESDLRKRILAAGLAAIDQIGSLGARAVEVVWECLVGWHGSTSTLEGAELALAPDVVSSLQLDYLLPQITDVLSHAALPSESLAQLLAVLHWLAQQSNQVAGIITATARLIPTVLSTFLLTPVLPKDDSALPNPLALQLLITLASASRSNASALLDPADSLLRFVTLLPPSSPYPHDLATTLLTYTLRLYTTLASYGLYSHIATTASQIFTKLTSYVLTSPSSRESIDGSDLASRELRVDWASLVQAWTVCATDPHATSPPHDILWSQVCALGWVGDVRKLRSLLGQETLDWPFYVTIWDSESAWLEGARINSIKAGEQEREEALQILRNAFSTNDGTEFRIVQGALDSVQRDLQEGVPVSSQDGERVLKSLASAGSVLASALRLWLACLPPLKDDVPLSIPPFPLPFDELSALSAALVKHPIWSLPATLHTVYLQVYLRHLTRFVIYFHRVSRYIPGTTPQLWLAQALVFLPRLLPGDEPSAFAMFDTFELVTPRSVEFNPEGLSQSIQMDVLRPFFRYTVWPEGELYVAPLRPNTESISRSSTLRLPSSSFASKHGPGSGDNNDANGHPPHAFTAGLPLSRDFLFAPLAHLLRSGTSPVFSSLPSKWAASEVDVVHATLSLAYAARRVLAGHGLDEFVHSAAEVVFACMQVCMLEHGVGVGIGAVGTESEVFRDTGVEKLMTRLLEPFTVRGRDADPCSTSRACTLEDASASYLGTTPFYQFYTDLVALYGAVSFGHRTFAALVATPLAMHYAVDYRRALWCCGDGASSGSDTGRVGEGGGAGLGDIVRSVRIPIEDVVCTSAEGDPREYLYPVERDVGVLGAYVAALVSRDGGGGLEGFLRLVAVHHVACTVWEDLAADADVGEDGASGTGTQAEAMRREETRARLLRVVLARGEPDVVRDVALYRQRRWRSQGGFVWPPTCYRGASDECEGGMAIGWREERLAFVKRAMGEDAAKRARALLVSTT